MPSLQPSKYQTDIFNWIESGSGDGFVRAVAGSGKTTTLVEGAKLLRTNNALFLAFNNHTVNRLRDKLPESIQARTCHGLGNACLFRTLGSTQIDEYKYRNLAIKESEQVLNNLQGGYQHQNNSKNSDNRLPIRDIIAKQLDDLVHFAMVSLTEPSNRAAMLEMIDRFGLDVDVEQPILFPALLAATERIIKAGEELAHNTKVINYDDMLYLPLQWNLRVLKFEWIFVDEAQDLSKAQLELALRARATGGRMLFVGDKRQAIYSFAGANCNSVDEIIDATGANVLPLSICYRCPVSHLKLAQEIVPEIEPRPGAPEGKIGTIQRNKVSDIVREGDLILSRTTASLVELCIELIGKQMPARVRGRDIGTSLTSIVQEVSQVSGFSYTNFAHYLNKWQQQKVENLQSKPDKESRILSLDDRCKSIIACYESFNGNSAQQLSQSIENLFSDERPAVMLSTIHRAKGLENPRVLILSPEKLPLKWLGQKPHELEQEWNLKYVALTRSTDTLVFISTAKDSSSSDSSQGEKGQSQDRNFTQSTTSATQAGKLKSQTTGNYSKKTMNYAIGIDLGTTNSVVSIWRNRRVETLRIEGHELLPSVVSFLDNGSYLVGHAAKKRLLLYPENTVSSAKRFMGDINKFYLVGHKFYSPGDIGSLVLKKIVESVREQLGENVKDAVITVPAYFTEAQREDTRKAGEAAGLNVLRLIPEPTAAAIAYGVDQGKDQTIMVYDLGGGTFDVSILAVRGNSFETIAVGADGDNRIGGDDFDRAIVDWACQKFRTQTGVDLKQRSETDREAKIALQRLKEAAEEAKIELSGVYDATISLSCLGHPLELTITRAEYNNLIAPFLQRTIDIMKSVLRDAGLQANDIDRVILVGGSTHTPAVREILAREIKDPFCAERVALVVSHGAGLWAAKLCPPEGEAPPSIQRSEVTAHSLGIALDRNDKLFFKPIIPRQTRYPCRLGVLCYTKYSMQREVEMKVYRGEHKEPELNTHLGELQLPVSKPQRQNVPVGAIFELDADGIIHFTGVELPVGQGSKAIRDYASHQDSALDLTAVDALINRGEAPTKKVKIERSLEER